MSDKRAHELRCLLGFSNAFGVKAEGLSGGVLLYWNNDSVVTIKSYSRSHIDVKVTDDNTRVGEWSSPTFMENRLDQGGKGAGNC